MTKYHRCTECGFLHRPFEAPARHRFEPGRTVYHSKDGNNYPTREAAIAANHEWGKQQ